MLPQKQLSLAEIYEDCKNYFDTDKPKFLSLLENTINLDELIPLSFVNQSIDPYKASMTIFDTSGIEAYVTENTPKYTTEIIKQLKAYKKAAGLDDSYDPYKAAYGSMPSHASSNKHIKQIYINSHFCYVYKFGIITNGLGIVRDISFSINHFYKSTLRLL